MSRTQNTHVCIQKKVAHSHSPVTSLHSHSSLVCRCAIWVIVCLISVSIPPIDLYIASSSAACFNSAKVRALRVLVLVLPPLLPSFKRRVLASKYAPAYASALLHLPRAADDFVTYPKHTRLYTKKGSTLALACHVAAAGGLRVWCGTRIQGVFTVVWC